MHGHDLRTRFTDTICGWDSCKRIVDEKNTDRACQRIWRHNLCMGFMHKICGRDTQKEFVNECIQELCTRLMDMSCRHNLRTGFVDKLMISIADMIHGQNLRKRIMKRICGWRSRT